MLEKAEDTFREQGSQILEERKKVRVTLKKAQKHIKKQNKLQKNLKMTEDLQYINSAMDILNNVSNKIPNRKTLNLNITRFQLNNENLKIEGEVKGQPALKRLEGILKSLAIKSQIKKVSTSVKAQSGWQAFAFDLKVQRREGK